MPSFCPKLESSIKVMHRRMAKNDQRFTKICFFPRVITNLGKINFHEFWTIFGLSTVHHLKKTPQNGMDLRKKTVFQFFVKNTGFLAFLVPYLQEKFIKMNKSFSEFFSKVNGKESVKSQPYHYQPLNDIKYRRKKNVSRFFITMLEFLPITNHLKIVCNVSDCVWGSKTANLQLFILQAEIPFKK